MKASTYPKIAQAIKETEVTLNTIPYREYLSKDRFINALCSILKADNPKFDENKFREACK